MAVFGTDIKAANILCCPKQEPNGGGKKLQTPKHATCKLKQNSKLWAGV